MLHNTSILSLKKTIALYIHIPFCKSKCYYCDFNSYASKENLISDYCNAVIEEINLYKNLYEDINEYKVTSIFFGGGTPSFIDSEFIFRILNECFMVFDIADGAEITIETNPGTLTCEKLKTYKKCGINRLSIGLQAWQDIHLLNLGRIHTQSDFINNYYITRTAGFKNINVDLIFGFPNQTLNDWDETIEMVTSLGTDHLSCYSLKVEEGTVLDTKIKKNEVEVAEDELDRDMYYLAKKKLKEEGFLHYEISNFAKPGFESKHNMTYWEAKEYIGFGAGAHSYFCSKRYNNIKEPEGYINNVLINSRIPSENITIINEKEKISEYIILGLRLIEGIDLSDFKMRFNVKLTELYSEAIEKLTENGLLYLADNKLKLTDLGLDLANLVFVEFI